MPESLDAIRHRVLSDECRAVVRERVGTPSGVAYSAIARMFSPLERWDVWKDWRGIMHIGYAAEAPLPEVVRENAILEGRTW